jgi:hypothetical protein
MKFSISFLACSALSLAAGFTSLFKREKDDASTQISGTTQIFRLSTCRTLAGSGVLKVVA